MKMKEAREAIGQDYVRRRLHYDPITGVFTWKQCEEMPANWNGRYAGKRAGTITYMDKHKHYACRMMRLSGTSFLEHHLAWMYMTGEWPPEDKIIDHKNRDATDNRWDNIRLIPHSENALNRSMHSRNSSGVNGVHWDSRAQKYHARVSIGGTRHNLGHYSDLASASEAVREFRTLNGFTEGSGLSPSPSSPSHEKTLASNSTSGCRYISWHRSSSKWLLSICTERGRTHKSHDTLEDAKRHLKEILDSLPDHPYHGVSIPE